MNKVKTGLELYLRTQTGVFCILTGSMVGLYGLGYSAGCIREGFRGNYPPDREKVENFAFAFMLTPFLIAGAAVDEIPKICGNGFRNIGYGIGHFMKKFQ